MKKLIAGIIGLVLFASFAQAQQYTVTTLRATNVAGTATATLTDAITLTKHDQVAIQLSTKGSAAGATGTVTATFVQGLDGTVYSAATAFTMTAVLSGTTQINTITNISPGAVGYIRLKSIANGDLDAAIISTNTVSYAVKPSRLGGR